MTNTILIYVTCASSEEAEKISQALVEQRLVACANILPAHKSIYRWEGEVQSSEEAAVIFKTQEDLFDKAEAAITMLHSYDCPCIIALPIEKAHGPYLEWIKQETSS